MDQPSIDRTELDKYKQTLALMKRTIEAHEAALGLLDPMHDDFERTLLVMCNAPMADAQKVPAADIEAQVHLLTGITRSALQEAKCEYLPVRQRLEHLEAEVTCLENQLVERAKAWSVKWHYELKVDKLKHMDSMTGTPKMDRNLGKSSTATNQWVELDAMVTNEIKRIVDDRYVAFRAVNALHIAHLKRYYSLVAAMFQRLASPMSQAPVVTADEAAVEARTFEECSEVPI